MTAENTHKVPKKTWSKWSPLARSVFNRVYSSMSRSQSNFLHPKTAKAPAAQWNTTCYNAAWTAADAADGCDTKVIAA